MEFIDEVLINPDLDDKTIRHLFLSDGAKYQLVYNWFADNNFTYTKKMHEHFTKHPDAGKYANLTHAAMSPKYNKLMIDGYKLEDLIGMKITLNKLFVNSYICCGSMNLRGLVPIPKISLEPVMKMKYVSIYSDIYITLLKENKVNKDGVFTKEVISTMDARNMHDRWVQIGLLWADVIPPYRDHLYSNTKEENKFIGAWIEKMKAYIKEKNLTADALAEYTNEEKRKMAEWFRKKYTGKKDFFLYDLDGKSSLLNHLGDAKAFKGFTNTISDVRQGEIIYSSFNNGIDTKESSIMKQVNLNASFSRAAGTANGGYQTKIYLRGTQNITISDEIHDCGTTKTQDISITKDNFKKYLHRYYVVGDKKIEITYDNVEKIFGKTIKMRSPLYCKLKSGGTVCPSCVGEAFVNMGIKGIGSTNANIGSVVMMIEMKKFHDTSTKTIIVNIDDYMSLSKNKEFGKVILSKLK